MHVKYYPVFLNLTCKKCLVVGGGTVAERKVLKLLECGARITVVATELNDSLNRMRQETLIDCIFDEYRSNYVENFFLVIGATDQYDVNRRIYQDATERGILVNIVDEPEKCNFIVPAHFEQGELSIAISTAGKSPALARRIKEELAKAYGKEYEILVAVMGYIRKQVASKGRSSEENKKIFEAVLDSDLLDLIRKKDWDNIVNTINKISGISIQKNFFSAW